MASQPPLPYRVLITGGAFVPVKASATEVASDGDSAPQGDAAEQDPLRQTYRGELSEGGASGGGLTGDEAMPASAGWSEPISLGRLAEVMRRGRVFVGVELDPRSPADRLRWLQGARNRGGYGAEDLLARGSGAQDLVLVVERLRDGPVERYGINGRWPVTLLLWISVGLGAVIPDHSYESRATLVATLVDPYSGRVLFRTVRGSGPVDLSLLERSSVWGWLMSILVPPFWVPDDDEVVLDGVRAVSASRLLVSVAREIKSVEVRQQLADAANLELQGRWSDGQLSVEVDAAEGLSLVRLLRGDQPLPALSAQLAEALDAGVSTTPEGRLLHRGQVPMPVGDGPRDSLQIIVQTLAGRIRSVTLPDPRAGGSR